STAHNISGQAYTFALGTNSRSATATDNAGNTGSASTRFTVQVNTNGVGGLVGQWVTDPAVVQGLRDKLATIAQGHASTKAGAVRACTTQVTAETGKTTPAERAAILIQLVRAL